MGDKGITLKISKERFNELNALAAKSGVTPTSITRSALYAKLDELSKVE